MKITITIALIGILVLSGFTTIASYIPTTDSLAQNHTKLETIELSIQFPNQKEIIIINTENCHTIQLQNYGYLLEPGKPQIPKKNLLIALPPDAKVISIEFKAENEIQLPGTYQLIATSNIIPLDEEYDTDQVNNLNKRWNENHEFIYTSDESYPGKHGNIISSGTYREYSYVSLDLYPIAYRPLSGKLILYESIQISIAFELNSNDSYEVEKITENNFFDAKASDLFVNYNEIKDYYHPTETQSNPLTQSHEYLIITSTNHYNAITSSSFIEWKTTLGYNPKIINVTDNEITSQSGIDLAEQIRNFLREIYLPWDVKYVLFVGDYQIVPMRYCYPDPTNHQFNPFDMFSGEVPTDYYYADLSSSDSESWDSDGDGYHGEFGQDNPDFLTEISVGRIPTNNPSRITYSLNKIVSFEQDTGEWKQHALHAGAFFYFTKELGPNNPSMDGAVLSYYIEEDIMHDWTISHYSEQEGLEVSVYDWPALNEAAFINDWRNGQYAIVNWQGHGWTNGVAQKIWSSDDGDEIPEANEMTWPYFITIASNLDDDYPSIVTAVSCYVGCPELNGASNLGIDLLTNPAIGAAVGIVSSARSPYGSNDWTPSNPGGSDSIIYEFNKQMIINHQKVGDALYTSKHYCTTNFGWNQFYEYIDLYTFNLYGDPSLILDGVNIDGGPEKPDIPSGPTSGKTGEEFTYISSTTDPDEDQLFYLFDWGDDTNSGWIGPFASGEDASASHQWETTGDFEVKVKAKDIKGLESTWSDPLPITIPKNKDRTYQLVLRFIEKNPILYLLFQNLL